jgi:hypothetical protein
MSNKIIPRKIPMAICLCVVFFWWGCQKNSHREIPQNESSDPVSLSFEVFNHTQGFLTIYEKSLLAPGSLVEIGIKDLGVGGVDENRLVIREGRFGARIAFSKTGIAAFQAPESDKNYTIYLMNTSHGADYRKVDTWTGINEGVLEYAPSLKWFREDKNDFRGPEDVIAQAVAQLNGALDFSWANYGRFQKIDRRENGSFGVGYGYCRNQFGWHSPYWAGINPDHCRMHKMKLATFLEEIFELITRLNDIGEGDTATLITNPETGHLNEIGRDLLAYVFVKDEKNGHVQ